MAQTRSLDYRAPRSTYLLNQIQAMLNITNVIEGMELALAGILSAGKYITQDGVIVEEDSTNSLVAISDVSGAGKARFDLVYAYYEYLRTVPVSEAEYYTEEGSELDILAITDIVQYTAIGNTYPTPGQVKVETGGHTFSTGDSIYIQGSSGYDGFYNVVATPLGNDFIISAEYVGDGGACSCVLADLPVVPALLQDKATVLGFGYKTSASFAGAWDSSEKTGIVLELQNLLRVSANQYEVIDGTLPCVIEYADVFQSALHFRRYLPASTVVTGTVITDTNENLIDAFCINKDGEDDLKKNLAGDGRVRQTLKSLDESITAHVNKTPGAHSAAQISVLDVGALYTATEAESALAEIAGTGRLVTETVHGAYADLVTHKNTPVSGQHNASDIGIADAGSLITGTNVETAFQEAFTNLLSKASTSPQSVQGVVTWDLLQIFTSGIVCNGNFTANSGFFSGDVEPIAHNTYDIGTTLSRFKDLFLSGDASLLGSLSAAISVFATNNVEAGGDIKATGDLFFGAGRRSITNYAGNPNTFVTANQGSLCADITNHKLYMNTDDATAWTLIGP